MTAKDSQLHNYTSNWTHISDLLSQRLVANVKTKNKKIKSRDKEDYVRVKKKIKKKIHAQPTRKTTLIQSWKVSPKLVATPNLAKQRRNLAAQKSENLAIPRAAQKLLREEVSKRYGGNCGPDSIRQAIGG